MPVPSLYPKEIMKHFKTPKNIGTIKYPDGVGKVGNIKCGDIMEMFIKVEKVKGKERISDIKFQTFGCVVAIAVSSILTTIAKGKTIEDALKLDNKDILAKAGKVPPIKVHCSFLAADALKEAIYDFFIKNDREIPTELAKAHARITSNLEHIGHSHE